jgi:hypothetical protein
MIVCFDSPVRNIYSIGDALTHKVCLTTLRGILYRLYTREQHLHLLLQLVRFKQAAAATRELFHRVARQHH